VRGAAIRLLFAAAVCACSRAPSYPRCERDDQCAVDGGHDYCVSGVCLYCRTAVDCADAEMCRAGRCLADPALARPDAGAERDADAPEADAADLPVSADPRILPSHHD
jgi:hypothetical protein